MALSPDPNLRGHFHGTSACLSALYRAERYAEIIELLAPSGFWPYKRWAVKALAAMGKKAEAIRLAESCRGPWTSDTRGRRASARRSCCRQGLIDEAYARYGVRANQGGTYLATFRAVVEEVPDASRRGSPRRLVGTTPGEEGKWFAAAKEAGLYDEAIALASRTPCDPKTLARAARDHAREGAGVRGSRRVSLALDWLVQGYGYEITSADVWAAYAPAKEAADRLETGARVSRARAGAHRRVRARRSARRARPARAARGRLTARVSRRRSGPRSSFGEAPR